MPDAQSPSLRALYAEIRKVNGTLSDFMKTHHDDHEKIIETLNALKMEDVRIDSKFTLITSNAKSFISGIAASFTFLGALIGLLFSYIFGGK